MTAVRFCRANTAMMLGVVDVGTNSVHLLVGRVGRRGVFRVMRTAHDLTRLGDGGLANGALTPPAMTRTLTVLRRYGAILRRCRADRVEAVATSAVREARNGPAFVRRAATALGVPLRVISGREEACLLYQGVRLTQRLLRPTAIIAIGGGSTQILCGHGGRPAYTTSMLLGGARLTQRFIRHDPATAAELEALNAHVRRTLRPACETVRRRHVRQAFGSSAMIQQVMAAAASFQPHRRLTQQPLTSSPRSLQRLVRWLSASTAAQRRRLPGLDPRRADLALATSVTLLAWMEGCGIARLRYAAGSVREGLVSERLVPRRRGRCVPDTGRLYCWKAAGGSAYASGGRQSRGART